MKVHCLQIGLAATILFSFLFPREVNCQDHVRTQLENDSQLRIALQNARDAVVAEITTPPETIYGSESADLNRIVRFLLLVGNRSDVEFLQQRVTGEYKKQIRDALQPAERLSDFVTRAKAVDAETNPFDHDDALELIVKQEVSKGYLDDAYRNAMSMRVRNTQVRALASVALAAHDQGNTELSELVVESAITRAVSTDPAPDLLVDHQMFLRELASTWADKNYASASSKARSAAKNLLESDTASYAGNWEYLGSIAAQQGDFSIAAEALEHLSDAELRVGVQTSILLAKIAAADDTMVLEMIQQLPDSDSRFEGLMGVAEKQIRAGKQSAAIQTLALALIEAEKNEQFRVSSMAEVAWQQIQAGDKASADATIEIALSFNEKAEFGPDQINGWEMLAEDLAALGEYDRALKVARKCGPGIEANSLRVVAYHETLAGHAGWALVWAEELDNPEDRARTFLGIIEKATGKEEDLNE